MQDIKANFGLDVDYSLSELKLDKVSCVCRLLLALRPVYVSIIEMALPLVATGGRLRRYCCLICRLAFEF